MLPRYIHFAFQAPLVVAVLWLGACGRTELWAGYDGAGDGDALDDAGLDVEEAGPDALDPPDPPDVPNQQCEPSEEQCNGIDDDCDGQIDEVPGIPCPEGGYRYCVAGKMSECPRRCEVCMPGSRRICFNSYCKYWATQTCTADGRSFGSCREQDPPPECADVASEHQYSRELEQCCIDNGYCCVDEFDLDGDGNKNELLGRCDEVLCQ